MLHEHHLQHQASQARQQEQREEFGVLLVMFRHVGRLLKPIDLGVDRLQCRTIRSAEVLSAGERGNFGEHAFVDVHWHTLQHHLAVGRAHRDHGHAPRTRANGVDFDAEGPGDLGRLEGLGLPSVIDPIGEHDHDTAFGRTVLQAFDA